MTSLLAITIYVTHALGPMGMSASELSFSLGKASHLMRRELGLAIELVQDQELSYTITPTAREPLGILFDLFSIWGIETSDRERPRLIALPMLYSHGKYYTGGLAQTCKPTSGLAIVTIGPANLAGESRKQHAVYTIAHELGHMLGAKHTPKQPCSIMGPAMLTCVRPGRRIRFTQTSKNEIRRCL